jgi:hypothetical protein
LLSPRQAIHLPGFLFYSPKGGFMRWYYSDEDNGFIFIEDKHKMILLVRNFQFKQNKITADCHFSFQRDFSARDTKIAIYHPLKIKAAKEKKKRITYLLNQLTKYFGDIENLITEIKKATSQEDKEGIRELKRIEYLYQKIPKKLELLNNQIERMEEELNETKDKFLNPYRFVSLKIDFSKDGDYYKLSKRLEFENDFYTANEINRFLKEVAKILFENKATIQLGRLKC